MHLVDEREVSGFAPRSQNLQVFCEGSSYSADGAGGSLFDCRLAGHLGIK